jgi:hypothetical protein
MTVVLIVVDGWRERINGLKLLVVEDVATFFQQDKRLSQ